MCLYIVYCMYEEGFYLRVGVILFRDRGRDMTDLAIKCEIQKKKLVRVRRSLDKMVEKDCSVIILDYNSNPLL